MGRPMTERELDDLSEQLGDGLGARARRREEVERMSLAEMEAELRGVREEIFLKMYFSLPDSIPPRPLGEARVRKH